MIFPIKNRKFRAKKTVFLKDGFKSIYKRKG